MRRVLLLVVLAACGTTDETEPTYGEGLGTPENPIPQDGVPYTVHTQTSSPSAEIQAEATSITASLRQFSQAPAHTMLGLATQAAPEELATLNTLSSTLRTRLEGWIDAALDTVPVDGMRARQVASEMADMADATITRFSLDSTLSFSPTKTTHTLTALSFRLSGFDVVVPVGGLTGDGAAQHVALTVGEGGALTFGDQTFTVDLGAHAWHGINLGITTLLGTGVDTALSSAANCRAVGEAVALKCVSGVCVGHAAEVTSLCEHSIASMVDVFGTDVASVGVSAVRFTSGTAHLVDENRDGLANRIDSGTWTPDPGLGLGGATFTAIAPGR
jgi:hypothetical protein